MKGTAILAALILSVSVSATQPMAVGSCSGPVERARRLFPWACRDYNGLRGLWKYFLCGNFDLSGLAH